MLTSAQKDLLLLLKQHQALDPEEAKHLKFAITYAELEPVGLDPRTVPAHFTGSAVTWDPATQQVLLALDPALPGWVLPGAHDDGQHDLPGTAQREAERRSGLRLLPAKPVQVLDLGMVHVPAAEGQRAHQHLDLRFLFLADASLPLAQGPGQLRWCSLEETERVLDEEGADRVVQRLRSARPSP